MNKIEICNIALTQLGCEPISSFDDGTTEATVASQLYEINKRSLLCKYPWRFCTFDEDIARLNDQPKSGYRYFYQLPNDYLIVRKVTERGTEVDFGIAQNRIVTDAVAPILTYTYNIPDDKLPDYFVDVLGDRLTARFCMPLTEDINKTSLWMKILDNTYREAKSQDAMQATTQAFSSSILLDVRG